MPGIESAPPQSTDHVIGYASPRPQAPRVWAAAVTMLSGLGLVALGGCFLIGVLMIVTPMGFSATPPPVSRSGYLLMVVLYALAVLSFCGAAALIVVGLRGLWRIMQGE